ncbi:MAG: NADH-quinone oxidoreductase subunit L, partial [Gammaproteobacteria bacterium]|nr:NADH-quinone oxidoreductase subunit L [Gammaproteobacteria bacterium]
CYCEAPQLPARIASACAPLHALLRHKYGFDPLFQKLFAEGWRALGGFLFRRVDAGLVDGFLVNGAARLVGRGAKTLRAVQTGLTYHYAFAMIIGLFALVTYFVWR